AGFSGLTTSLGPERLGEVLRSYFDTMGAVVLDHEGTIERVLGDSLVAFFNAPLDQPDHRDRALRCALALDAASDAFREEMNKAGIAFGETRIGINTGSVAVGNFGSATRVHYTALGDPINGAARLEAANKLFGTRILAGAETVMEGGETDVRPVGEVALVGQPEPLLVYEPLASSALLPSYLSAYTLLETDRAKAKTAFAAHLADWPHDPLAAFHLRRLEAGEGGYLIRQVSK
ncbi:MAG: adenylate/guanylate cyclase domain-containing protein, partial [Pseudomonadota bacterium]